MKTTNISLVCHLQCVALENDNNSLSATYDETALEGFASLARFADEQYQQITEHTNSPIFESKQNLLQALKSELNECQEFIGNRLLCHLILT